jgi:hypothetical protein
MLLLLKLKNAKNLIKELKQEMIQFLVLKLKMLV